MQRTYSELALTTLEQRYYLRDEEGELLERTPEELWRRTAKAVASVEENSDYWEERCYQRLCNGDFMFNTPTLMNAGKENGQLSACFVLPIEDSIEGIYDTLKHAAIVHKTGGGTGFDFSSLRPEGSMVSNKTGVSTGPMAFCQVYDKSTSVIKQGSSRRGANMMTLRVDHPDILDFIKMKSTPGVMENFNVSVCITDKFMEALEAEDDSYDLWHPFTGVVGQLSARKVWSQIAYHAWNSAEPGIIFIDTVNRNSPFHEEIVSTNPCGEQPLPPYGACNLGSINISNFVLDGRLDWNSFRDCIHDMVRMLDNVIDVNSYPLREIDRLAKKYRNIGMGPMGLADAFIKMGIPYNSRNAVKMSEHISAFMHKEGHEASYRLAMEKGFPEGYPFANDGVRRNATVDNSAPTGTISLLAGCSSGIEPNFAFEITRNQLDSVFVEKHPLWAHHIETGNTYKPEAFVEAQDVEVMYHIQHQAAWQQNVDAAISKTINLPEDAQVDDIMYAYKLAYETGCKGVTVYRDGSRGVGVLSKTTVEPAAECCENPSIVMQDGCESCTNCGVSKCSIA